jgi:putative spermidine/putrescine transport system ATP-binding protein
MNYLEIKDLNVHFDKLHVIKNVDLSIEKGQFVTFLGPSGCGKSTLMRTIAGLEQPSSGTIKLDGEEIQDKNPRRRNIGMVFQQYALFPNMTVAENVAFGLKIKKIEPSEMKNRVAKMLDLVGLTSRKDFYPSQLSGGQQQRVSLARALVVEPKVLLLDEPLSALDAKIRKQLQKDLRDIQRKLGITMIFVTHDQEEAMILSDIIYVMNEGNIAQAASPKEIYTHPNSKFVADFIGNYNQFSHTEICSLIPILRSNFEVSESYSIRPELIRLTKETKDDLHFSVELKTFKLLGSIVRATFLLGDKEIYADFLNDKKIFLSLEQVNHVIYINPKDFIAHKSSHNK